MKLLTFYSSLFVFFILAACEPSPRELATQPSLLKIETIGESYFTERLESKNVDSPALWHGPDSISWVITTAKESDELLVYNAKDGSYVKTIGSSGTEKGQLDRPNGLSIMNNFVFVVERDNHRVQVFDLPSGEPVLIFGEKELVKPYGLYIHPFMEDSFRVYVTDNFEWDEGATQGPNERIKVYEGSFAKNTLSVAFATMFGDSTPSGKLWTVESIYGDPENNRLLIADEDSVQNNIKIYDLKGDFTGTVIPNTYFNHQPEGITLYDGPDRDFWILTDQASDTSFFHVFDRVSLDYRFSFIGETTANTDGIWLDQTPFGMFRNGLFLAVHDDGNVAAFDFAKILAIQSKSNPTL